MFSVSKNPTINEIHSLYREKKAAPSQVVAFFLNRSKQLDKHIKSILRHTPESAENQGYKLDNILAEFEKNKSKNNDWFEELLQKYPLFGIPYNLKDNILVEGQIAASASKILWNFRCPYSATVYLRLEKAGAILISQSNLDEWAVGSSTENSAFGPTKNPYNIERVPGGSSGGPTANVASGQAVFSLASDTGGSIRQPSAFCNVVGLKPTYGLVSRYGLMALSSSLDQIGPITNSVLDNLLVLTVISGKDPSDQTSLECGELKPKLHQIIEAKKTQRNKKKLLLSSSPKKIGLPKEYFAEGLDDDIREMIQNIVIKIKKLGHDIIEVELPLTKYGLAVYQSTMTVETAANLQRYDGVRYGWRGETDMDKPYYEIREKWLGNEPKRRIMLGTFASAAENKEERYDLAEKVKQLITKDFSKVFERVDLLLTPTTVEFPFKFGEKTDNPLKMYLSDALVLAANLVNIPAINVPLGLRARTKEKILSKSEEFNAEKIDLRKLKKMCHIEQNADDSEVTLEDITFDFESYSSVDLEHLPTGCQLMGPELSEDVIYQTAMEIEALVKQKD